MDSKFLIWTGMIMGSAIGGLIPALWGDSMLSFSSIIFSAIGGVIGVWLGFKISH